MSLPYTYNGLPSVDVWYLSNFYLRRFYAKGKLPTVENSRLLSSFLPFPLSVSPLPVLESFFMITSMLTRVFGFLRRVSMIRRASGCGGCTIIMRFYRLGI